MNAYTRIFLDNPDGEEILKDLMARFRAGAKTEGGIGAILETYVWIGQRSVLEYIISKTNLE